jgi:hypothetical protein
MDSHRPASIRSLSEPKLGSLQVGVRIRRRRCHLSREISAESPVTRRSHRELGVFRVVILLTS